MSIMTVIPSNNSLLKKSTKIKVLVADDHPLLRRSLKNILEEQNDFQVVAEASDGEEAAKLAAELEPDVVIMDIGMPKLNGLEATRLIKASHPNIAVLVLTVYDDEKYVLEILKAGAAGYLTKSVFGEEVVQAVRGIITGEVVLSPSVAELLLNQAARYPTKPVPLEAGEKLSIRELEIIKLAARGMSNKDIAAQMRLSLRTVKGYLAKIYSKLGVASRTEAVVTGLESGFVTIDDIR